MNLSLSGAHSRLLAGLRATAERGGLPHLLALQVDGATRSACIQEVRRSLARGRSLGSGWWSSRSLPLLYIAAQQAYGYPGSGHAYWSGLEALLEHPLSEDDRTALAGHFRRLALLVTGSVRPSDSPWERAYSRIAWPIAHAVLPRMVQLPFALALQRMVALRGSPRATAPPAEVGKSLGTELGSTSNTLLRSLASDEARTGELVLSLLHPGRLGTVFQPSFVDRLRADLESAPEARAALRAGSATPGADRTPPAELVELLLDWEELELFVDLSGALRSHREALHARAYDQVEWMGGVSLLGQLALTPLPVEVMRCDGARARLFPTTPPGLSKELAATLESLVLDLSSPLVFAAGDSRLCREGLGGAGIHRVLVREAGSAPVGGTQLFSVAGLLCFQYPDRPAVAPSRVSQSGGGPTLRVLAPPDLRSRRGSHIRTLLQADPVVEVEVGTSGEARCRPLDRVPGDAVVRTESPGWSSFLRVTLSPANTLALRSGRSSLHIEGPAGDANVTVRVAMEPCVQVAGRGYPAVFLARLDRLPGGFKPQSPLMRRLADAAHATAPEHGLVVRVSVGGGAPEAVAVQGVVRTAWREAGVLRGEHEVGELDAATQAALLRVLDSQTYRPLGSNDVFRTHVRVVAATNRDLATEVAEGRFRRDLFHRLDVLTVRLPPLRERRTDIELLATHFLEQFDGRGPRAPRRLADDALQVLQAWRWPGNVRELRNAIERAVVLAPGPRICLGDLPEALRPRSRRPIRPSSLNLSEAEARLVRSAMERAKGNQTDAAKLLGISRPALRRRLSRLGLLPKQGDSA